MTTSKKIEDIEVQGITNIIPHQTKKWGPYKVPKTKKTTLIINNSYIGETIEEKIRRITTSNEPIEDTAPIIYTERKNGVQPEYNIRTDRFELAIEGMDKYQNSITAERKSRETPPENKGETPTEKTE